MDLKTLKARLYAENPSLAFDIKNDIAFQVGRQIERIRVNQGKTQAELAASLGTKQSAISRLERGASMPSLSTLKRIANFLGTYVDIKLPLPEQTSDKLNHLELAGLIPSFLQPNDLQKHIGLSTNSDAKTNLAVRE